MNPPCPQPTTRQGNAPLEMVMFLPLLIVMFAGMLTVTQVAVTDSTAATAARHVAFDARRTPYQDGPLFTTGTTGVGLSAIDDILGPGSSIEPDGGLILSGVELPIAAMFDRFKGRLPNSRAACAVVGDTWDHEQIRFKKHGRLTLGEKVNYFTGGSIGNLASFSRFVGFSIGSGSFGGGTPPTSTPPTGDPNPSPEGSSFWNVAGRTLQFAGGAYEFVTGGAMAGVGALGAPATGGTSLLATAGGIALGAHGIDQMIAALRNQPSAASRLGGAAAASMFGEEFRGYGEFLADFGTNANLARKGILALPQAFKSIRTKGGEIGKLIRRLQQSGRLSETLRELARSREGLREIDALRDAGELSLTDLLGARLRPDNLLNSTAGRNSASAVRLARDLRAAELANPVVDSLRLTGRLPSRYVTKSEAVAAGWKPGKALGNHLPNGQIGGDLFRDPRSIGLPTPPGRVWREADIGLTNQMSRSNQAGTRILYSNDGLAYVTSDHYASIYRLPSWRQP